MKESIILVLVLTTVTWFTCAPPVVFSEPQPQGYAHQHAIPFQYRGTFFCDSDSSIVHVKDKVIYKKKLFPVALTIGEIDSIDEATLIGNKLYIESVEKPFLATVINDSVFANIILSDTLFQIGEEQVINQFRGHQILNRKRSNGDWEVAILSLDYNFDLVLSFATFPEDLERLNEITPVTELSTGDTIQYKISPTVYEFNQILKEQLVFEACDFYKRIALPAEI